MCRRAVSERLCAVLFIVTCTCGSGTAYAEAVNVDKAGGHTADQNADGQISLSELLRVIQFFNLRGYHCDTAGEDGSAPGPGDATCAAHDSDYDPQDWSVSLSELLRRIQSYNFRAYHACPGEGTEDTYCPGLPGPDISPPGNVSDRVAVGGDGQVTLSWLNLGDADLAGVRVVRGTGAYIERDPGQTGIASEARQSIAHTALWRRDCRVARGRAPRNDGMIFFGFD